MGKSLMTLKRFSIVCSRSLIVIVCFHCYCCDGNSLWIEYNIKQRHPPSETTNHPRKHILLHNWFLRHFIIDVRFYSESHSFNPLLPLHYNKNNIKILQHFLAIKSKKEQNKRVVLGWSKHRILKERKREYRIHDTSWTRTRRWMNVKVVHIFNQFPNYAILKMYMNEENEKEKQNDEN